MPWTFIQSLSAIGLTLVGLLEKTYDAEKKPPLRPAGWYLLIVCSIAFVWSTVANERKRENDEARLLHQTEEIGALGVTVETLNKNLNKATDRLFTLLLPEVMQTRRESVPTIRQSSTGEMRITSPTNGSEVPARPYLEGIVSDSKTTIWVIVHPLGTGAYWVQPAVNVREDGTWKTQIYLGRAGNIDAGTRFEVVALGDPSVALEPALVLDRLPESKWRSQIIELIRR